MSATMLRRSASQPFQSQRPLPRSVGNTPPLPVKHNLTSHYMPLQAYEDYQQQQQQSQQQQHHQMRQPPSNSVYNGTNVRPEFILTPRQAQQLQQRYTMYVHTFKYLPTYRVLKDGIDLHFRAYCSCVSILKHCFCIRYSFHMYA